VKICFINILYSKLNERGGLGAHIQDLSRALARRGHQVTVLTSGSEGVREDRGVKVVSLGKVRRYSRPIQLLNPVVLLQRLRYMIRATRYALKASFNVIEAADGGLEQLFLVLLRPCPIITKLHGNFRYIYARRGLLTRVVEMFEAAVVRRSNGVYTSTDSYAGLIAADYRIPLPNIEIIPYGIDITDVDGDRELLLERRYSNVNGKKIIFLTVGSSAIRKGAEVFLEVARTSTRDDLLFVLSCSDLAFLSRMKVPGNVLILPNLDRNEFYEWLSRSTVVVFPSHFESFSIAVREAMFFGKPIIASVNVPVEGLDAVYPRLLKLSMIEPIALSAAISNAASGCLPEADAAFMSRLRNKYDINRVAETTEAYYQEIVARFKIS
jgi:glycosyltransferase involved in cell wall biosynthesis